MKDQLENAKLIAKARFEAVIFDLDGVVTQTARVHAAAWKELFDRYRQKRLQRDLPAYEPFDAEDDYRRYVDGKPRYDGIESFLSARGIDLPYGKPDDPPEKETICGLGNRKNALFRQELKRKGVQVYDSTVQLIHQLRSAGFKVAIISASKNCAAVLETAQLKDLFHAQVDGRVAEDLHLNGKPAPDVFLEAAKRLGVDPGRAVVVEDAQAGVEAGRKGNFGLVIGVDRSGKAGRLKEHGADVVVSDLREVRLDGAAASAKTSTADLPSALTHVDEILVSRARRLAVFLDYDGTLTPIVSRPEDAVLTGRMREVVRRLAQACTVAVISGRDLADVRARVGLEGIIYAGSHGFDIEGPGGLRRENPEAQAALPALDEAESALKEKASAIRGAQVERKKYSIAIHFRNAEERQVAELEDLVAAAASEHPNLRRRHGKKVFELQPNVDWDKGRAVLWLLRELGLEAPEILPLYVGDDLTDEDAFEALREKGVGVVIRDESRPTAARYALENPLEVGSFLTLLATPSTAPAR